LFHQQRVGVRRKSFRPRSGHIESAFDGARTGGRFGRRDRIALRRQRHPPPVDQNRGLRNVFRLKRGEHVNARTLVDDLIVMKNRFVRQKLSAESDAREPLLSGAKGGHISERRRGCAGFKLGLKLRLFVCPVELPLTQMRSAQHDGERERSPPEMELESFSAPYTERS
jgi:hypothetical protein